MPDNSKKDNSEAIKILSTQLSEQNQFARTNIQLLVQWFIFFATANYVVLGYFVLKMADAPLNRPLGFYWGAALFIVVNLIAGFLCWHAYGWFSSSTTAAEGTLRRIQQLADSPFEFVAAPPPYRYYAWVSVLMGVTVLTMLGAWVAMIAQTGKSAPIAVQTQPAIQVFCNGVPQKTSPQGSPQKSGLPSAQAQTQVFCELNPVSVPPTQPPNSGAAPGKKKVP